MADTMDSKSIAFAGVPVQVRPEVSTKKLRMIKYEVFFYFLTIKCKKEYVKAGVDYAKDFYYKLLIET
jgi:hypothetical protein